MALKLQNFKKNNFIISLVQSTVDGNFQVIGLLNFYIIVEVEVKIKTDFVKVGCAVKFTVFRIFFSVFILSEKTVEKIEN